MTTKTIQEEIEFCNKVNDKLLYTKSELILVREINKIKKQATLSQRQEIGRAHV